MVVLVAALLPAGLLTAQSYLPQWKDPRMAVQPAAPLRAYAFDPGRVKLLPGPFQLAREQDVAYLLSVEPDRLLSDFRIHSGLRAKGARYAGWESSGLAGHSLGHYLSALSLHYAGTGNAECLRRVQYMVTELAECQAARKTGYIGAIPNEDSIWTAVAAGHIRSHGFDLNGGWSPWYTVHKVFAGLLDAYLHTGNRQALAIATGLADWTGRVVGGLNEQQLQQMLLCEYGGMAETLVNLYAITGKRAYLELSYKFYDKAILDPLADQKDILPGKHSNTQIPKIIATARRYQLNLDEKDNRIAQFFWKTVVNDHTYVTGGNSNYEYLGPPRQLNHTLTESTTETCNTYNMLKLTRHLFARAPSAQLMDYYERALYNHILASQRHTDGMMCYFVPLRMGGRKEFSTPFTTFTCCVGSGMENHVKYNESIYFQGSDSSLYVNLFIPSVLNWQERGVTLTQETKLPAENTSTLRIGVRRPVSFSLRIRRPAWAEGCTVTVNGRPLHIVADAEGYLVIRRRWQTNDRVVVTLPAHIYTEALPDNPARKALLYGPVVLAGLLGDREPDPAKGIPVLVTGESNERKWLQLSEEQPLAFRTAGIAQPGDVTLVPFYQVDTQYYSVYWDVFTPATWAVQQQKYEGERRQQQALEARTMDRVRLGEMQPERDHHYTDAQGETGEDHQRKFRVAHNGGFLEYTLKTDPDRQNTLINTYWGTDNRGRVFDVLADGIKITTEDLNRYKESRFYEVEYLLPIELTKGKTQVTIRLQAKPGNDAGPVYGSRMVKQ